MMIVNSASHIFLFNLVRKILVYCPLIKFCVVFISMPQVYECGEDVQDGLLWLFRQISQTLKQVCV